MLNLALTIALVRTKMPAWKLCISIYFQFKQHICTTAQVRDLDVGININQNFLSIKNTSRQLIHYHQGDGELALG